MGPFSVLSVSGGFLEDMTRIGGVCFSVTLTDPGDTLYIQSKFYPHGTAL